MVDPITANQKSALNRALRKPLLLPILIKKISGLQWFDAFEEAGLLLPEKNPHPIHAEEEGFFRIPPWVITEYLVSSSDLLKKVEHIDYAEKYIAKIREVTKYAIDNGFGNYRTWVQFSKILSNLPPNLISLKDIDLVEYWLSDKFETGLLLEGLSNWILLLLDQDTGHSRQLVVTLLDKIYTFTFDSKKLGSTDSVEAKFKYHSYAFDQFIEKTCFKVGQVIGLDAITLLQKRLETILQRQNDDLYSALWRPAIEEHSQNMSREDAVESVLISFRDALLGLTSSYSETTEAYIKQLLTSEYNVIKRVAVHVISEHFDIWNDSTNPILVQSPFFTYHFQHEVWRLLDKNFDKFSSPQKKETYNIINQIVIKGDNGQHNDRATAFQKLNWLTAIKDKDNEALQLYDQEVAIAGQVPEHPGFSCYSSSSAVLHKSEVSVLEMASIPTAELVIILNEYEQPPQRRHDGPSIEGLAKEFRAYVKTKPSEIINDLELLKSLRLIFIYELIEAYSDLWNKPSLTSTLDWNKGWNKLIGFYCDLVLKKDFWGEENNLESSAFVANRSWIVGSIGRFIESGCREDDHAFDSTLIEPSKDLLIALLSRQAGNKFEEDSNAVSIAINSPRGKCIEALINLALFSCRQAKKNNKSHEEAWKLFEPFFTQELTKADNGEYEFSTLGTNYLRNFIYLSSQWVTSNLPDLFCQENKVAWRFAMQGYSYVNKLVPSVYEYLKDQELFFMVLDDAVLEKRVKERFIQLMVISYLQGRESLEENGCLLKHLIDRQQTLELQHLIRFAWSTRASDENDELAQKIIALWPMILEKIDISSTEGKKLASQMCLWTTFITKLEGEQLDWITKIAPFAELNNNGYVLLKNLARLSKEYPLEAANVWQAMLERSSYDYPEESITEILINLELFGQNGRKAADVIVSKYMNYGYQRPFDWLRNIRNSN